MHSIVRFAILLALPLSAIAEPTAEEQALLGTYKGHMHVDSGMMPEIGMDLVIEHAEGGRVTATLTQYNKRPEAAGSCNGKFPMKGTFRDNKLRLRTNTGGDGGNCPFRFEAVKEGDKLIGATPRGGRIELSK